MNQNTYLQRNLRAFRGKILLAGIPIVSFFIIAQSFIFLNYLYTNSFFWRGLLSKVLLILSFIVISISYISTHFVNKNNWPQVKGTIINSHINRNIFSKKTSMILDLEYSFVYKAKKYNESSSHKIDFRSEEESLKFSKKFSKDKLRFINVYVFKYNPRFSSTTEKINILYLLVYFVVIVGFVFLFLTGFLYHLINTGIAKIITDTNSNGSISNSTIEFQKSIYNFGLIFDSSTLVIVSLILFVLIMFSYKLTTDLWKNKIFYTIPKIDSNYILSMNRIESVNEDLICSSCNYSNDSSSIFCFDCGKNLWT